MKLHCIIIAMALAIFASPASCETLDDLLASHGVPSTELTPDEAKRDDAHFAATTNNSGGTRHSPPLVVAFYDQGNSEDQPGTLTVLRYDHMSKKLDRARLPVAQNPSQGLETMMPHLSDGCFGSIESVSNEDGFIAISTHVGPDAGCTIILNPDLSFRAGLDGWRILSRLRKSVVFQESMPHFAPIHALKLWLFTPDNNGLVQLYPMENDPERQKYSDKLKAHMPTQDFCRAHNLPCDSQNFSSRLLDLESSDETQQMFFDVEMTADGFGDAAQTLLPQAESYEAEFEHGKWVVAHE